MSSMSCITSGNIPSEMIASDIRETGTSIINTNAATTANMILCNGIIFFEGPITKTYTFLPPPFHKKNSHIPC